MGGSFIYLWGTMQGLGRSEGKSIPETGLQCLGQGSRIRAMNGEGRAGLRCGVLGMGTKVWRGWDMQWKVLEGAGVVGTRESEFRCYTECNTPIRLPFINGYRLSPKRKQARVYPYSAYPLSLIKKPQHLTSHLIAK